MNDLSRVQHRLQQANTKVTLWRERAELLNNLLAHYRVGSRRTPENTLRALERNAADLRDVGEEVR